MKKGDFVFYSDPRAKEGVSNNLITVVLEVFPKHNTCIIWWPGTTCRVSQEKCTILPVQRGFSIMVPEEPFVEFCGTGFHPRLSQPIRNSIPEGMHMCSPGNRAEFRPVPLEYFGYGLCQEGGRVFLETPGA